MTHRCGLCSQRTKAGTGGRCAAMAHEVRVSHPQLAAQRQVLIVRPPMARFVLMMALLSLPLAAAAPERSLSFTKMWTHGHTTPGQVSEIPAFDARTNTVWVAGVVGVDVLDAR